MSSELDQVTDAPTTGRSFSRSRTAPAVARRFVRDFLADAGANARCQQVGELLVSELVTNALVHARTSARLWVSVTDDDDLTAVTFLAGDGYRAIHAAAVAVPMIAATSSLLIATVLQAMPGSTIRVQAS